MKIKNTILFVLFLFSIAPAWADSTVFILTGDTRKGVAEKKLADISKMKSGVRFANGFPKLIASSTLKGLNPGFWVVIGGSCQEGSAAALAVISENIKEIPSYYLGGYAKSVPSTSSNNDCPLLDPDISPSSKTLEKDLYKRALSLKEAGDLDGAEYAVNYLLMINPNNTEAKDLAGTIMVLKTN